MAYKKKKVPAKRGPKPKKIDYAAVERHAALGLTKGEIANALDMGHNCFFRNRKEDPKIEEAITRGRAKFKVHISNVLVNQAQNGNVSAAIWLDKTRCGTRETKIVEVNQATKREPAIINYVEIDGRSSNDTTN